MTPLIDHMTAFYQASKLVRLPAHVNAGLRPGDLLIAPRAYYEIIKEAVPSFAPAHMTPEDARKKGLQPGPQRVLVFALKGERQLVRRLRQRHSQKRVLSLTMDIIPQAIAGRVVWKRPDRVQAVRAPRILLVSAPGSDADYVAHFMAAIGFHFPRELIHPLHVPLMALQQDFSIIHALAGASHWLFQGAVPVMQVKADVLQSLSAAGHVAIDQLRSVMRRNSIRVLHLERRDRTLQALSRLVIDTNQHRSTWAVPPRDRSTAIQQPDLGRLLPEINQADTYQRSLREWLDPIAQRCLHLAVEDAASDPEGACAQIAAYLGVDGDPPEGVPSYQSFHQQLPSLSTVLASSRRDFFDRLGMGVDILSTP